MGDLNTDKEMLMNSHSIKILIKLLYYVIFGTYRALVEFALEYVPSAFAGDLIEALRVDFVNVFLRYVFQESLSDRLEEL